MRIEIQLRIVADDNRVISEGEIVHFDKGDDRLEGIGLSFDEAKAALAGIPGGTAQAARFLARHRSFDLCGSPLLWCTEAEEHGFLPWFVALQAARTEFGRPRSSIRLRTVTAIRV